MDSSPILILLIVWLIIGLPMKLAKQVREQAAKNAGAAKAAPQRHPKAPKAEAPQSAAAPLPEEGSFLRSTVMEPTIHITEHDDSVYRGSMNADTGEGYDPCHDEQMQPLTRIESEPVPRPQQARTGLPLGWTGNDVVRGIVMSEILNRKNSSWKR